jgi:uncharacterized protein (TIGR04255 family)
MFELGPASQYKLGRPPLAQALAQVRFPLLARLQTFEGIAPLQEALLGDYPYMEKVTEAGLSISAGQPAPAFQPEMMTSWHFTDDDGRLIVLNSNSLTLSVSKQYDGFTEFRERFSRVLSALQATLSLRRCQQVGVRFVNLVDDTGDEKDQWKRIFGRSIVGWPASEIVHGDTRLQSSVSQIQLASPPLNELADFPADVQAVIRHGIAPAKSLMPGIPPILLDDRSFFLDLDIFVAAGQEFDVKEIINQFHAMHSQIDRFFYWALTLEGKAYFELEGGSN